MATCKECGREFSTSELSFWDAERKTCRQCKEGEKEGDAAFIQLLAQSNPRFFITPILLALNALVFVVMVISGVSIQDPTGEQLLSWGANFGPLTASQEWWRLFTCTFVHIGILHIALNMWVLWGLGKWGERMFGNWTFLMLYVLSGLGGSIASIWWNPTTLSAGASGAVFGAAGGVMAFLLLGKLEVPRPALKRNLNSILVFVAYNVFYGFGESGIDNAAHLGGLATGFVLGAFLHRPLLAPSPANTMTYQSMLTESRPLRHYLAPVTVTFLLILGAGVVKNRVSSDPMGKYLAANRFLEAGEVDKAITAFREVVEKKPDFAEAHHDLGVAYESKGLHDQAIASYKKALELKPDLALGHLNLCEIYLKAGFPEMAADSCRKGLELKPDDLELLAAAHYNLGLALLGSGQVEEAKRELAEAQRLNPELKPPQ